MSTWMRPDPYYPRANPNARDEISALRAEVRERKEENAELRSRIAELEQELDCVYFDLKESRHDH